MKSLRLAPYISIILLLALAVNYSVNGRGRYLIHAFSTTSRHISITSRTTALCTYAIFQDDDCEDLCEDFGDDFSAPTIETLTKSTISHNTVNVKSKPRRSRPLWWTDPSGLDQCKTCNKGEQMCRFCGGTDFLSAIGGSTDALFMEGIGQDCPVCRDGSEVCGECAGTGVIFTWSPPNLDLSNQTSTYSLHP